MSEDEFAGLIEAAFITIVFNRRIGFDNCGFLINNLETVLISFDNDFPDCVEYFKKELKKLKGSKNVETYELPSYKKRRDTK